MTIAIDFWPGSRFAQADAAGDTRRAELDALLAHLSNKRTARAWQYRENLREVLNRKPVNRNHLEGIVVKRKARGYRRLSTIRTIIFLIAGKLDIRALNPHAA